MYLTMRTTANIKEQKEIPIEYIGYLLPLTKA